MWSRMCCSAGFHQGARERARLCGVMPRKGPYAEKTPLSVPLPLFPVFIERLLCAKAWEGSRDNQDRGDFCPHAHTPVGKQSMTGWTHCLGWEGGLPEEVVFKSENYRGKQGVAGEGWQLVGEPRIGEMSSILRAGAETEAPYFPEGSQRPPRESSEQQRTSLVCSCSPCRTGWRADKETAG